MILSLQSKSAYLLVSNTILPCCYPTLFLTQLRLSNLGERRGPVHNRTNLTAFDEIARNLHLVAVWLDKEEMNGYVPAPASNNDCFAAMCPDRHNPTMVFHQIWASFEGVFSDGIQDDINTRAICLVIDDAFVALLLVVNNPVCSKALYEFDAPGAASSKDVGSEALASWTAMDPTPPAAACIRTDSPTFKRARSIRHP